MYISCVDISNCILPLQQVSEFDLFTLDDIDSAFQNMTRLTYSQNYHMSGRYFFSDIICLISIFALVVSPFWRLFSFALSPFR